MRYGMIVLVGVFAAAAASAAPLIERLAAVRSDLRVVDGHLAGPGGALIDRAVGGARYVLIGEDHFSREIPRFTTAICRAMGPGLRALAVEIGPEAAAVVNADLRAPDRAARMAAFMAAHPDAMAFQNGRDENDMAAACAQAAGPALMVWGLDQEFLGASSYLLEAMRAAPGGPEAGRAVADLSARDAAAAKLATASGDPSKLLTFTVDDATMAAAGAAIDRDGSARQRALFAEFATTRAIYREQQNSGFASNGDRARLMKRTLAADLAAVPAGTRVLFKFGDYHMYKGINPLRQRDVGNFVAERAEGDGATSLHIMILGARGVHALYGGYGRPLRHEPFVSHDDPELGWIDDALAATPPDHDPAAWSVFDLRPLRPKPPTDDAGWRRRIDGYDLLVIIPELTPSDLIGSP